VSIVQIVVAGAGYAGVTAARALARRPDTKVTLIEQNPYHLVQIWLHEVAAGTIPPEAATIPLEVAAGRNVDAVQACIDNLDLRTREVHTTAGLFPFDKLVISLGGATEYYGIPGLQEHAFQLKSLEQAIWIREHLLACFQRAQDADGPARRPLLTAVVGGGGLSGVELAGELADELPRLAQQHALDPDATRVVLVEARPRILSDLSKPVARYATRVLRQKGVEILAGVRITGRDAEAVHLKRGAPIEAATLIWAGGVRANPTSASLDIPTNRRGMAVVDPFLRVPDFADVYVIGDAAWVPDPRTARPVAPSAQLAVQEAKHVHRNLSAMIDDRQPGPYVPQPLGQLISLGRDVGVATVGPLRIYGRMARWMKWANDMRWLLTVGGVPLVVRWQGRYGHGVARPPVGVVAGGGLGLVAGLYLAWQVLRRLTRSG
jgi:NADH dehydrogenase